MTLSFFFFFFAACALVINKSDSNEKLKGMNKPSSNYWRTHETLSHETNSQAKVSESMLNDGMKGVIRLLSMHQYVKNQHSKWREYEV